jgi:hypothetical protein
LPILHHYSQLKRLPYQSETSKKNLDIIQYKYHGLKISSQQPD